MHGNVAIDRCDGSDRSLDPEGVPSGVVSPVMDPTHFVAPSFEDPIVARKVRPHLLCKKVLWSHFLVLEYSWTNQRFLHSLLYTKVVSIPIRG